MSNVPMVTGLGSSLQIPQSYASNPPGGGNANPYGYALNFATENSYLTDSLNGNTEWINKMRQSIKSDINEADSRARREEKTRLARTGMLSSGVASQSNAELTGKKERALVAGEAKVGQMEDEAKKYAIGQLLNIKGMQMQNHYQGENLAFSHEQFNAQQKQWQWQNDFQMMQYNQAQEDKWMDFFAGVIGTGIGYALRPKP